MNRLLSLLLLTALAACSAAHHQVLEAPSREKLAIAVQEARDEQKYAKKGFTSALEEFLAVTGVRIPELENRYNQLARSYEESRSHADAVKRRIDTIERVGGALFKEWEAELAQYASDTLRQASTKQFEATRERYSALVGAMKSAESKMRAVLAAFNDQVLFLKHNLNARAVEGLQGNADKIQALTTELIREMEKAIAEANAFVRQM